MLNYGMTLAYKSQINCCKKNNIAIAVVTKENEKNFNSKSFNFLYSNLKKAKPEWELARDYYLTCPDQNSRKCWQRLIYLELKKGSIKNLDKLKRINFQEYYRKFRNCNS